MTKLSVCGLLACLLMAGSAVAAPTVYVMRTDGHHVGDVGEYTLTPNSELANLLGSSAVFESFCLEKNENVYPYNSYRVRINDEAVNGGGNDGDVGAEGGDPLCQETAYLYTEFRAGTLTGYDFAGAGRAASAEALQNVIWYLEDEIDTWTWADGSLEDIFLDAAEAAIAAGEWEGVGNVCVLTLTNTRTGANVQDMLGLTPTIPAPGAIVLGALGSCVVGFLRRRYML